jgi:hypothetical protein
MVKRTLVNLLGATSLAGLTFLFSTSLRNPSNSQNNGLEEGQSIHQFYIPSLKGEKRVVFDKEGNPMGFNVFYDHDREVMSYLTNPQLLAAYNDHLRANPGRRNDNSFTSITLFSKEDQNFLKDAYKRSK